MQVHHKKTSGVANPVDPGIVGGEDWNDPHDIAGPVIGGTGQYTFGSGGNLSPQATSVLDFAAHTGTGTYRSALPSADFWYMIFARAVGSDGTHYDVDVAFDYSGETAYVDLTVKTRAGAVIDVTSGSLWVLCIDHGI